jgi:3-dehydroquinate dehydratase-2
MRRLESLSILQHSFTSLAVLDALKMFTAPIVEYHISNIHRREPVYHRSYVSLTATAVMAGLGATGYKIAMLALRELIAAGKR